MKRQDEIVKWLTMASVLAVASLGGRPLPQAHAQSGLDEAQKTAGLILRDRLRREDAGAFVILRRCPPRGILLVDGKHDHTDRVLHSLRLPFRRCSSSAFSRESLSGVRLLIVDCPGDVGRAGAHRIAHFVERGGTLLTTDWAVLHVLELAFPGTVRYTRRPTRDDVVRISRVDPEPLLHRVFPPGRLACWWIENHSYPVEVLNHRRVRVILESHEMAHRYGSPVLGLTFRHGRGRVVHIVSHTYLQRNELREPWERRSAEVEADRIGIARDGKVYRELKESGTLGRIAAGDLNAALSAQQFLLNITLDALERGAPGPPRQPPPRVDPPPRQPPSRVDPPPRRPPVPRPGGARVEARVETHLRDKPGGTLVLLVRPGLGLMPIEKRDGWVRVRTPAGQSGWIERRELR